MLAPISPLPRLGGLLAFLGAGGFGPLSASSRATNRLAASRVPSSSPRPTITGTSFRRKVLMAVMLRFGKAARISPASLPTVANSRQKASRSACVHSCSWSSPSSISSRSRRRAHAASMAASMACSVGAERGKVSTAAVPGMTSSMATRISPCPACSRLSLRQRALLCLESANLSSLLWKMRCSSVSWAGVSGGPVRGGCWTTSLAALGGGDGCCFSGRRLSDLSRLGVGLMLSSDEEEDELLSW
mmetsp:Transcript_26380/g.75626  ORF Transcript_26380/g.75626 Transcript_26380/m.75626 type:complete len:245 (-) Transcript_26380:14-748(-)